MTLISINLKDLDLDTEEKAALHAVAVQKRNNLCHIYEAEIQKVQISDEFLSVECEIFQ